MTRLRRLRDIPTPARLAKIKTEGLPEYAVIVETARIVLRGQRLPEWIGRDRRESLIEKIVSEALDAQVRKPLKGKWLKRRVSRIARTISRDEWFEKRHTEIVNGEKVRRSTSVLRIADPREGLLAGTVDDAEDTGDTGDKVFIDPLDSVELDSAGRLITGCPKNRNNVEDRMIAALDLARLLSAEERKFIFDYVANLRQSTPATPAERTRFHRLKRRCNVQAGLTVQE